MVHRTSSELTARLYFVLQIGLLHRHSRCTRCRRPQRELPRDGNDGIAWRCGRPCGRRLSIRHGTFFSESHLSLATIVELVYLWVHDNVSCDTLHHELDMSNHTLVDWKSFCRDICGEHFLANPVVVGGPGIVVEIDESLFCRRKYNVGRLVREQWVFGGIEVGTPDKKAFLVAVPRRDAATLLPIITQFVAPGSTIISDCWRAYNTLGLQGYTHLTVNHSINFVDPNTGACTNHIENYWQHAKQRNKREYGTARTQLDSYLIEYMWRARYHKNMQTFIEHVRAVYPPH